VSYPPLAGVDEKECCDLGGVPIWSVYAYLGCVPPEFASEPVKKRTTCGRDAGAR
jgi:hypothetical protein